MIHKRALQIIMDMKNSSIYNYILPGFTSSLIGGEKFGKVRLFTASRHQHEFITPHTHRFDFACYILQGFVENKIWAETDKENGDLFESSLLIKKSNFGEYNLTRNKREYWFFTNRTFQQGDWYFLDYDIYHSISFSQDAIILFFEGPQKADSSYILEPVVDNVKIPTFKVEDWMFQNDF